MTKTFRPFFSGGTDDEAIAIGTMARMSTSPSAVTAPETRLCIDFVIMMCPFDDTWTQLTNRARQKALSQPVTSSTVHPLDSPSIELGDLPTARPHRSSGRHIE